MPQVAALHALTSRVLALPEASGLLTPAQRTAYAALAAMLPPLPLAADGQTYAAAAVVSSGGHNSEGPWLYATHPFRINTVGTAVAAGVNISTARATWAAQSWFKENQGWSYGGLDAALLGLADAAYADVYARATLAPATDYRFPTFAPHLQDYQPSADHHGNLMATMQLMLLQTGEDGFGAGTIVLLPAWRCDLDVSFKLFAAQQTTVEVVYANKTLVSLDVVPPSRAAAVKFYACVPPARAAEAVAENLRRGEEKF